MIDVCRNIDLNKSTHNDDMAIIVLQSLEVRIVYLEVYLFIAQCCLYDRFIISIRKDVLME